jgi:N-acetylneuraminate synthase/N,N'-diacetyllegionaminate synthase
MNKTLIIAEAGVNHNGNIETAKQLIDVATEAGVDFVKFQTFKAETLVSEKAKKAAYQEDTTGSGGQFEMLKKLELSDKDHHELIAYCKQQGVEFLSSAFDVASLHYLNDLGISCFKIPSGEITNLPYLKTIAGFGKPVILSTGMATLSEIEAALNVLTSDKVNKDQITILHCNTEYPTPMKDVNLMAMLTIKDAFKVNIGYSDHTLGIEIPIAAVALGAVVIEKHFTLDRNLPGPDHRASLEPNDLKAMVSAIRNIELATSGNGMKVPSKSEAQNKPIVRKSIHLRNEMVAGQQIEDKDLIALRPGTGISTMDWERIVGKTTKNDLPKGHLLAWSDLQ